MTVPVRRVLLVHGAWGGSWCWQRLLAPLRSQGYRPEAIDLPGHGDSLEAFGDLHGDADAVRSRLDAIGEPTLLVGHSYGGMVVTDAGTHDAVHALAYVCAFMPTAGQSAIELLRADPPEESPTVPTSALLGCVRVTDDGSAMLLEGDGVVDAAFGDCDPEAQRWALERLGPHPTASVIQPPRHLAWTSKPSTYVVCTEDRAIPEWQQRRMAKNATRVVEMKASHFPLFSMPDELAEILAAAAQANG